MKTSYFIYFVLIAPVLSKIIEWIFQFSWMKELITTFWYWQIFFILTISTGIFLLMLNFSGIGIKKNPQKLGYIVGISYFLKELWNLIFVYKTFTSGIAVALIIEPVFMYTILGVWLPKLIFEELRR